MTKKVMKLLNPNTGLMKCKVCGAEHYANYRTGWSYGSETGRYYPFYRGAWKCHNGCKLD